MDWSPLSLNDVAYRLMVLFFYLGLKLFLKGAKNKHWPLDAFDKSPSVYIYHPANRDNY